MEGCAFEYQTLFHLIWQRYKVYKDLMQHTGQLQKLSGFSAQDSVVVWTCMPLPFDQLFSYRTDVDVQVWQKGCIFL